MLFYIGIALGRFLSGIISERLGDIKLIITGTTITILSLLVMIIPGIEGILLYSLIIVAGMGCGPIFPSMVHYSPAICGNNGSQLLIGCQLAMASAGSIIIPALFSLRSFESITEYLFITLCFHKIFTQKMYCSIEKRSTKDHLY